MKNRLLRISLLLTMLCTSCTTPFLNSVDSTSDSTSISESISENDSEIISVSTSEEKTFSGIVFSGKTFDYDGDKHSIYVSNAQVLLMFLMKTMIKRKSVHTQLKQQLLLTVIKH